MSLRVTAIAIVGYEHDYLARILKEWIGEGFTTDEGTHEFASDLLDRLDASLSTRSVPALSFESHPSISSSH